MAVLSDLQFLASTRTIFVKAPRTVLSIQDLVDSCRDWEINDPIGSTVPTIFTAGGKERLDATNFVGITMTLWGWTIQFEARSGPATVLCEVNGGNLVAQTNLSNNQTGSTDTNPFTPSAYVQVTYAKSASPTLTIQSTSGVGTAAEVAAAVWDGAASSHNLAGTLGEKLNAVGASANPWNTDLSTYTTPGTAGYELNGLKTFQTDISTQVQSITPASTALHTAATSFTLTSGTVMSGSYTDTHSYDEAEHYIRDNAGAFDCYYDFNIGTTAKPTNFNFVGYVADKHEVCKVYAYNWVGAHYEQIGEITGYNTNANFSWALYTSHVDNTGKVRIRFATTAVSDIFVHIDQIYVGYMQDTPTASAIATQVRTELTPELTHIMQVPTTGALTTNQATMLLEMYNLMGLDPTKPLVVTKTSRQAGSSIQQQITGDTNTTVVTRI